MTPGWTPNSRRAGTRWVRTLTSELRRRPPRSSSRAPWRVCRPTIVSPLRYMVGVALMPLSDALPGLGTHGCLLRPGAAARVPRADVETCGRRDGPQPCVGERAQVLAALVGEQPIVERPVALLLGGAPGAGAGLDGLVVGGSRARPLERRVVVDDPERAGRHVVADERRLDDLGELAARGALEVRPELERDGRIGLAERPALREGDRGR